MLDTRKVVLTRFNTGRERGVNTGVSTVEQPLQLSMQASEFCLFLFVSCSSVTHASVTDNSRKEPWR